MSTVPTTPPPVPIFKSNVGGAPRKHPRDNGLLSKCLTQIEEIYEEGEVKESSPVNKRIRFNHGSPRVFRFDVLDIIRSTPATQPQSQQSVIHDAPELKLPPHHSYSQQSPRYAPEDDVTLESYHKLAKINMSVRYSGYMLKPWWIGVDESSPRRKNLSSRSDRSLPLPIRTTIGNNESVYVVTFPSDTTHLSFLFNIYNWRELCTRPKGGATAKEKKLNLHINDTSVVNEDECKWRLQFLQFMGDKCPWYRVDDIYYNGEFIPCWYDENAEIVYKKSPFSLLPRYKHPRNTIQRIDNIVIEGGYPEVPLVPDLDDWLRLKTLYVMDYIRKLPFDEPMTHFIVTDKYDSHGIISQTIAMNTDLLPSETRSVEVYGHVSKVSTFISNSYRRMQPEKDFLYETLSI